MKLYRGCCRDTCGGLVVGGSLDVKWSLVRLNSSGQYYWLDNLFALKGFRDFEPGHDEVVQVFKESLREFQGHLTAV